MGNLWAGNALEVLMGGNGRIWWDFWQHLFGRLSFVDLLLGLFLDGLIEWQMSTIYIAVKI